jgi:hypothetical protein
MKVLLLEMSCFWAGFGSWGYSFANAPLFAAQSSHREEMNT